MHVILTHEQADFDALASLLGAYLLDERAIPVLPRRMNRNIQAFLTLYGAELPFVDPRDLPNSPIQAVTLVDTQSMVSLKGLVPQTQVWVIDHHPLRDNLPSDWKITREEIGATTTLIVEALRENDILLMPIQATLLLLGIYEDTGSLTFGRTTARDLQAAAYLIEQGANLRIAADFLNHPLSPAQQVIYDQLRNQAETHRIHGHNIVITSADAQDMDEELSTIAHKLRDLLDPDAMFVLVTTRGGVQIIARSTTDHIDVAEILATFGGGGHDRAAAALVRGRDIAEVKGELHHLLASQVRPAVTVAQIMSRDPQVLKPDTPVEEAARRMSRFGYEGYPVVQDGKVIGLLTRRAVDRAMAHNLHRTANSLMDAGQHTITPDDSIEQLQRLMTDSGWGQVPVVEPASGEVIGIVTRTDLLKILAPKPRLPGAQNLAERLDNFLPESHQRLLKAIAQMAHEKHSALYIVGGFVRDLLLSRPVLDYDLVVEGDAIQLASALARRYGGRVTSHARFGTAKWHLDQSIFNDLMAEINGTRQALRTVDLVSARTEFYTYPSALPTVERGSIKLDLHRRDFTINTLALRLDGRHFGELHDYWGGLDDLHQRWVRVLHSLSFIDDPTRMLRAVRFEKRFDFQIERRTLDLLQEAISLLERVSGDRIRHELNHILVESHVCQIIARLDDLNLLSAIHPCLTWDSWLARTFSSLPITFPDPEWGLAEFDNVNALRRETAYLLWLLRLSDEQARLVCDRLRISVTQRRAIMEAVHLWKDLPSLLDQPPSRVVTRLEEVSAISRFGVYLAVEDPKQREMLLKYTTTWRKVAPRIDGHGLRRRGLPPGPLFREILSSLRNAWLDGEISTPEQETELMERLIAKPPLRRVNQ
jgi:tRNA nucleotidyltransferase (CCA-adding enzyme)